MTILFDTHTFLWFIEGNDSLSISARRYIKNIENRVYLSAASYWEICIKISIGKLRLKRNWRQEIDDVLSNNGITWLEIKKVHLQKIIDLPWRHRDPFDRLLLAQALTEDYIFCTADKSLAEYGVEILG